MDNEQIEIIFIKQIKEFINQLQNVFYDIEFLKSGEKYISTMNEKYIIKSWKKFIGNKYKKEINSMNINNIINKFKKNNDCKMNNCYENIFFLINNHINDLSETSKNNIMIYISNLTELSILYNN